MSIVQAGDGLEGTHASNLKALSIRSISASYIGIISKAKIIWLEGHTLLYSAASFSKASRASSSSLPPPSPFNSSLSSSLIVIAKTNSSVSMGA